MGREDGSGGGVHWPDDKRVGRGGSSSSVRERRRAGEETETVPARGEGGRRRRCCSLHPNLGLFAVDSFAAAGAAGRRRSGRRGLISWGVGVFSPSLSLQQAASSRQEEEPWVGRVVVSVTEHLFIYLLSSYYYFREVDRGKQGEPMDEYFFSFLSFREKKQFY